MTIFAIFSLAFWQIIRLTTVAGLQLLRKQFTLNSFYVATSQNIPTELNSGTWLCSVEKGGINYYYFCFILRYHIVDPREIMPICTPGDCRFLYE